MKRVKPLIAWSVALLLALQAPLAAAMTCHSDGAQAALAVTSAVGDEMPCHEMVGQEMATSVTHTESNAETNDESNDTAAECCDGQCLCALGSAVVPGHSPGDVPLLAPGLKSFTPAPLAAAANDILHPPTA